MVPPAIFCYDNYEVLRGLNSESVDLVYLDPPFQSGKIYHAPLGSKAEGASFSDIWHEDTVKEWQHLALADTHPGLYRYIDSVEDVGQRSDKWYLIFMAIRLIEIRRILKPTGSVFLHCDPTASHYLKLVMDAIWGRGNFANEIVWAYKGWSQKTTRIFPKKHDTLLFYYKDFGLGKYRQLYQPITDTKRYNKVDEEGRRYKIYNNADGTTKHVYLDDRKGVPVPSYWTDIYARGHATTDSQWLGYPTQKPLRLLERIIEASTDEGDLVLDPFAGCATACEAADNLNRRWVGIDVSDKAYELIQYRLDRRAKAQQLPFDPTRVAYSEKLPRRTDLGDIRPLIGPWKLEVRTRLYGEQHGNCKACGTHHEIPSNLAIDHIHPVSKGGTDHLDNLQLLCTRCNSMKGNRPMEYLAQRITRHKAA